MEKNPDFLDNLYFDPIKSLNLRKSNKRYRLKERKIESEEEDKTFSTEIQNSLPTVSQSQNITLGSVIIQNWETKRQIPKDLPNEMMHFPVLIDRSKFQLKQKKLKPLETNDRYGGFSQKSIYESGNKLALSQRPIQHTEIIARDNINNNQLSNVYEEENKKVALTESSVLNFIFKR